MFEACQMGPSDALETLPVGAALVARLADVDPAEAAVEELCGLLGAWNRVSSWAAGQMMALTARLGTEMAAREQDWEAREEVQVALRVAPVTAELRLEMAAALATRMPATLGALRAGEIGLGHVYALRTHLDRLSDAQCGEVEGELARQGASLTPGALGRVAARVVNRLVGPAKVADDRDREHFARLNPTRHSLYARFDAADYAEIEALLAAQCAADEAADDRSAAARCPAEPAADDGAAADPVPAAPEPAEAADPDAAQRSKELRQLDALVALLLGRPEATVGRVVPTVGVLVPWDLLAGGAGTAGPASPPPPPAADRLAESAELAGAGPIDTATAQRLACDGRWMRLAIDPVDGRLLDAGRTRREPTERLRHYLIARDEVCRFPGCSRDAARCDAHHLTWWSADGTTDRANLVMLCRRHHRVVHEGGWRTGGDPERCLGWTSPTGQRACSHPRRFPVPGRADPAGSPGPPANDRAGPAQPRAG